VSPGPDWTPDPAAGARGPAEAGGLQIPAALLATIEGALNRYLALDPEGARGLAPIQGRIIGLEVEGLGIRLTLIPGADRLQLFGAYDATPDCLIRGAPLALLRMLTAERKESAIGGGGVAIEGDSSIGHELAKALAGLDVDWEEQLSRVVGDPIAHPVGEGLRGMARWGRRSAETLRADLKEYLEEEARLLPSRYEINSFLADVDTLRDDVERLEARLDRLARGPEAAPRRQTPVNARRKGARAKGPTSEKGS
jgi:ubiquinone biosynthesis accessory factor UbiJ